MAFVNVWFILFILTLFYARIYAHVFKHLQDFNFNFVNKQKIDLQSCINFFSACKYKLE